MSARLHHKARTVLRAARSTVRMVLITLGLCRHISGILWSLQAESDALLNSVPSRSSKRVTALNVSRRYRNTLAGLHSAPKDEISIKLQRHLSKISSSGIKIGVHHLNGSVIWYHITRSRRLQQRHDTIQRTIDARLRLILALLTERVRRAAAWPRHHLRRRHTLTSTKLAAGRRRTARRWPTTRSAIRLDVTRVSPLL